MIDYIWNSDPYNLNRNEKQIELLSELNSLVGYHLDRCIHYRKIMQVIYPKYLAARFLEEIPFLPIRLFKMLRLISVPESEIIKILTSSGTSGHVSQISLDRQTAIFQTKALVAIGKSFLGKQRLPMVIIDQKKEIAVTNSFSARAAGIMGFANFGRDHFYLLDESMGIDWKGFESFVERHPGEKIFFFGFTFMVWRYLYQAFVAAGKKFDFGDSILIHGGGWKKLTEEKISNRHFKGLLRRQFGLGQIYNYYGMIEQVGSIFMECSHGYLHAPVFADVLVRDTSSLSALPFGKSGLVQVLSILPRSYPGHSLLTDDLGVIQGEDDCRCGRKGKYFQIEGRLPAAELRGCSDTHAYEGLSHG